MDKSVEIEIAKRRRAKLLAEFNNRKMPMSMRTFAARKGLSVQRISQLLILANKEK